MMIDAPDYLTSTNAAYKLLLNLKINKLPVDLNLIISKMPDVKINHI